MTDYFACDLAMYPTIIPDNSETKPWAPVIRAQAYRTAQWRYFQYSFTVSQSLAIYEADLYFVSNCARNIEMAARIWSYGSNNSLSNPELFAEFEPNSNQTHIASANIGQTILTFGFPRGTARDMRLTIGHRYSLEFEIVSGYSECAGQFYINTTNLEGSNRALVPYDAYNPDKVEDMQSLFADVSSSIYQNQFSLPSYVDALFQVSESNNLEKYKIPIATICFLDLVAPSPTNDPSFVNNV